MYSDKVDQFNEHVDYIKCDPIPVYKRQAFIAFHNADLSKVGVDLNWIKN